MIFNRNAVIELHYRGYRPRHIAIVMGCSERVVERLVNTNEGQHEPGLDFLTQEQKQRLYVLDKLLILQRLTPKFVNYDYCYITILKFLQVPRETVYNLYKNCPIRRVANAYKEKAPFLQQFEFEQLGINSEEWGVFVCACYKILCDPEKWK